MDNKEKDKNIIILKIKLEGRQLTKDGWMDGWIT